MRNPTTTAYLPTLLACVPDLRTALASATESVLALYPTPHAGGTDAPR